MIRVVAVVGFWAIFAPVCALIGFPWTFITGKIDFLYRLGMWGARAGVRIAGASVIVRGLEQLDRSRNYIFMSNHVSNLDPPVLIPLLPGRTSVLVKKELFRVPLLGQAMRMAQLVAVDRSNREAAIRSVREAAEVLKSGLHMTVFPEGTRSRDGRLLPFKKGPFYMAADSGVPIVPVTIVGTYAIWPKGRFAIRPGQATVVFHRPIDPRAFAEKEPLIAVVRERIESALPAPYRN